MNFKKTVYPHIYEFQRLGMTTPEAKKYYDKHEKELESEYGKVLEIQLERQLLGIKKIHSIDEKNDI